MEVIGMKENEEEQRENYAPFESNLCNCFGMTEGGQIIWFDSTGSPFRVAVVGEELVQGRLLDLPAQKVLVIGEEEAYQQLINTAYPPLGIKPRGGYEKGRNWILVFLLGLAAFGLSGIIVLKLSQQPTGTGDGINSPIDLQKITIVAGNGYNPVGPQTISLATFTNFLKEMNSPALPEATSMYQTCVMEGGDPALALAFFEHESGGGTAGVAVYTHSIGNIRCSPGYECFTAQGNGSFRRYSSWTEGTRDWVRLLKYYRDVRKLSTLEQIIPVYAPAADHNNESAYITGVKKRVDELRNRESK